MTENPSSIAAEWQGFRESVLPPNASEIQIQEMQKAFYAGAVSMMTIWNGLSALAEEEAVKGLGDVQQEMATFFDGLA